MKSAGEGEPAPGETAFRVPEEKGPHSRPGAEPCPPPSPASRADAVFLEEGNQLIDPEIGQELLLGLPLIDHQSGGQGLSGEAAGLPSI